MTAFPHRVFWRARWLVVGVVLLATHALAAWKFAAGDADRDGYDDLALIGNGEWYVWMSGQNYAMAGPFDLALCGGAYALGDLDGDRQPDLTMLSGADWFLWRSGNGYAMEGPLACGVPNGMPYLHDFDEDGRDDPAVVVGNAWHVWRSRANYARAAPFGFDPGAAGPRVPIAFAVTIFPGTSWEQTRHFVGWMINGRAIYRWTGNLGQAINPIELVQGVPVFGRFDGHQGPDLAIVQRLPDAYRVYTYMSGDAWERRGPFALRSGNVPGVAAMAWQDTNGCYAAASVYDIGDLTNARVDVNGTPLVFRERLAFGLSGGRETSLRLPFYYAVLTNVQAGDALTLSVYTNGPDGPALMYRSAPTVLPDQVLVIEPSDEAHVLAGQPVPMQWTPAAHAQGTLAWYLGPDDYTPRWDGGWHIAYVPAPRTAYTIPPSVTITGAAEFGVAALNGDVQALVGAEDTNDCFFVAASGDETETVVVVPVTDPLFIAKEYALKVKGLRFQVRESDPYRMPHPGTVTVHLKLRRWRISSAFVAAYDMNGAEYFAWDKTRVFKRQNKNYTVTFPCRPGSTIAIGTHHASFQGASYWH